MHFALRYSCHIFIWCRGPESNRYGYHYPRDFKSLASASSATAADKTKYGGDTRNRTGDKGFADLCLTAWLWCRTTWHIIADGKGFVNRKKKFNLRFPPFLWGGRAKIPCRRSAVKVRHQKVWSRREQHPQDSPR